MALVPYVIEQSSRGERSFDIYSRLLEDRIVMLNEEVNSASASVVVAQLLYLALPNSDIMIHQPSGGAQGQATDMEIHTRHILDMKKRLNQILADNTGQPIDVIAKDTNRDNFMTAQQALEYGLIDKVIEKR